jgi:hypothetical protein
MLNIYNSQLINTYLYCILLIAVFNHIDKQHPLDNRRYRDTRILLTEEDSYCFIYLLSVITIYQYKCASNYSYYVILEKKEKKQSMLSKSEYLWIDQRLSSVT